MSEALLSLLLEVRVLAALASWEPVGSRLEAVTDAAQGRGSVSEPDIVRLRAWARRWARMQEPVRAFYVRHMQDERPTARVVLWQLLHGRRPQDWQAAQVQALWQEDTGCLPLRDLCPIIR